MNIRVVLKQYKLAQFKGIFRELKIFTYLENDKTMGQGVELHKVLNEGKTADGLPVLLGYKIGEKHGEILMTNGGQTLDVWQLRILREDEKMYFMADMLCQVISGLQKIHEFGYSHGDLKHDNICARLCYDGTHKFTLIDLGMCSKLFKPGADMSKKYFRGNYIYCHASQIKNKRPTALDDIYSLVCVAYQFVFGKLPWLKNGINLFDTQEFTKSRVKNAEKLDKELVENSGKLQPLFKYLIKQKKKQDKCNTEKQADFEVDYSHMLSIIPKTKAIEREKKKPKWSKPIQFLVKKFRPKSMSKSNSIDQIKKVGEFSKSPIRRDSSVSDMQDKKSENISNLEGLSVPYKVDLDPVKAFEDARKHFKMGPSVISPHRFKSEDEISQMPRRLS